MQRMSGWSVSRAMAGVGRAAVPVVAVAIAVVTIAAGGVQRGEVTRLAQLSPVLLAIDVLAGLAIVVSGSICWVVGHRTVGLAAILGATGWFGSDWAGNPDAPGVLRALGIVAAAVTLPMLAWAVVATLPVPVDQMGAPCPHWGNGPDRRVGRHMAGRVGTRARLTVPRDLRRESHRRGRGLPPRSDPFERMAERHCRPRHRAGGRRRARIRARDRGDARGRRWPVLVAAVLVGLAWAAWAATLLLPSTVVPPAGAIAALAFVGRGSALIALAGALMWWTLRSREIVRAVRALAERLDPFPGEGSLAAGLADVYRDPGLRLAYALPDGGLRRCGRVQARPAEPEAVRWLRHRDPGERATSSQSCSIRRPRSGSLSDPT